MINTPPAIDHSNGIYASGDFYQSPGGSFCYKIVGMVCRLYDREELPYPCCRIQWMSKEPSWNRQGKRFVPDIASCTKPSYQVQLVDYDGVTVLDEFVLTIYYKKLSDRDRLWWKSKYPHLVEAGWTNGH